MCLNPVGLERSLTTNQENTDLKDLTKHSGCFSVPLNFENWGSLGAP
jgi:hypothetical protein